jgi:hypothetical protein
MIKSKKKIEGLEEFSPAILPTIKNFTGIKVLQILVI